jgi:hypothetical protein
MLRAIVAVRAGISWPDAAKGPDYLFPDRQTEIYFY